MIIIIFILLVSGYKSNIQWYTVICFQKFNCLLFGFCYWSAHVSIVILLKLKQQYRKRVCKYLLTNRAELKKLSLLEIGLEVGDLQALFKEQCSG